MIEVVSILVAAADREHAGAEHIDKAVHDPRRIALIREHPGQFDGLEPRRRSAIARSITPLFEVRRPPSKVQL